MTPYPIIFDPILREKVWGGRTLETYGKPLPGDTPIGESWELADLPDSIAGGRSVIANGALAGTTLRDAIAAHRETILGGARPSDDGGFPLLIKYLDARANLSIQVHPDEAYVEKHPDAHLKSEAWVIVDAEPDAVIYKGVRPGVTRDEFAAHIESGAVVDDLVAVPVQAGDCHYLPSGTCHALGAGLLVAEVQTPSDTTFRVYDWGRTDRELHIDESLECIRFDDDGDESRCGETIEVDGITSKRLTETPYFRIERLQTDGGATMPIETSGMPVVWMVLAGDIAISGPGFETMTLGRGATTLLPAALENASATLFPGATLLHVTLPSPARGAIA